MAYREIKPPREYPKKEHLSTTFPSFSNISTSLRTYQIRCVRMADNLRLTIKG